VRVAMETCISVEIWRQGRVHGGNPIAAVRLPGALACGSTHTIFGPQPTGVNCPAWKIREQPLEAAAASLTAFSSKAERNRIPRSHARVLPSTFVRPSCGGPGAWKLAGAWRSLAISMVWPRNPAAPAPTDRVILPARPTQAGVAPSASRPFFEKAQGGLLRGKAGRSALKTLAKTITHSVPWKNGIHRNRQRCLGRGGKPSPHENRLPECRWTAGRWWWEPD